MGAAGPGLIIAGGAFSALGTYGAGVYNNEMAEYDAKQLDALASDAVNRGEEEANKAGVKGAQFLGEQRATLAGQGIDVGTGTAADLQQQTLQENAKDIKTIRLNAQREALGIRTQAFTTRSNGKQGLQAAQYQAGGTLLTAAGQAAAAASSSAAASGAAA